MSDNYELARRTQVVKSLVLADNVNASNPEISRQSATAVNVPGLAIGGTLVTATPAELNDADLSAKTQAITAAGAISLDARVVNITGPAASTYAITLAAPTRAGQVMVIEMTGTTATNAVTLALTNVVGGSAATSASFNAAGEILSLVSGATKWLVTGEAGVTLS